MSLHTDPASEIEVKLGEKVYIFGDHTTANIAKKLWRETNGGNSGFEAVLDHRRINYLIGED